MSAAIDGKDQQQIAPKAVAESAESLGPRRMSKDSLHKETDMEVNSDINKVKFTKNGNDSAVEIGEVDIAFAGMGKEELMKFANDPFWVKIRWTLFILFWIGWLAMLVGAIVIVVLAPKCPPPPPLNYWQKGVVYHAEVKSFQDGDSNQDGLGDLKGVIGRLGQLKSLGVNMLLLPPIFKQDSPDTPYGFGIMDFQSVDPTYGTMDDMKNLITVAKAHHDIKIVMDFVPNHSSKQHDWFKESASNASGPYKDYYVWKGCEQQSSGIYPNKLTNVFNQSAWTYEKTRDQCYYHAYGSQQPDFNLAAKEVQSELKKILEFWLNLGVSGFRLLSVPFLYENDVDNLNLPENLNFISMARQVLNEYETKDGQERVLLVEPDKFASTDVLNSYYGSNETNRLVDLPINNKFIYGWDAKSANASDLRQSIKESLTDSNLNSNFKPAWAVSNRDRSRISSRLGEDRKNLGDGIAMIQMLLPGTPIIYYGDEIGMGDVAVENDENCGVGDQLSEFYSCDKARSPYQWDGTPVTAGFTNNSKPWHPVASSDILGNINFKSQLAKEKSHLAVYRELLSLRNQPAVMHGEFSLPNTSSTNNDDILSFIRIRRGTPGYIVVVNFSSKNVTANFEGVARVPAEAQVLLRSSFVGSDDSNHKNQEVPTHSVHLEGYEGLVLSFVPEY